MATPRRQSTEVDVKQLADALEKVPSSLMQASNFVPYAHTLDFKRAPSWEKAAKYCDAINFILGISGGLNVHQVNMLNGFKHWAATTGGSDISAQALEKGAYVVRAIISQIANYKSKPGTSVPSMWQYKFQTIWDKTAVREKSKNQPQQGDEVEVIIPEPKPIDVVEVSDTDPDPDVDEVLRSDDPYLHRLLNALPTKRLRSKTQIGDQAFTEKKLEIDVVADMETNGEKNKSKEQASNGTPSKSILTIADMQALADPEAQGMTLKGWANLNKDLKKGDAKLEGTRVTTVGKLKVPKGPMKAMKTAKAVTSTSDKSKWQKHLNNVHSKAYGAEKTRLKNLGLDVASAEVKLKCCQAGKKARDREIKERKGDPQYA